MTDWAYLVADLKTDETLEELPLDASPFTRQIKGWGTFNATLSLDIDDVRALNLRGLLQCGQRALYVERDGQLVWCGILWRARRAQSEHKVTLQALELESYFARRLQTVTYQPMQTDQLAIFRQLVAAAAKDIRVTLGTERSGVMRDRTTEYMAADLHVTADLIKQLADVENGFDYMIEVLQDSDGARQRLMRLGYPRLGRSAEDNGLVFESPGNILDWDDDYDAFASVTEQYEVGDKIGTAFDLVARESARDDAALARGVPLLQDVSREHSTVTDRDLLRAHARTDLAAAPVPITTYACTVRADVEPVLGSYHPGDEALYVVSDDWHREQPNGDPGLQVEQRIVALSIDPKADTVTHTLGPIYQGGR